MMKIQSLLNPLSVENRVDHRSGWEEPTTPSSPSVTTEPKRQKISKVAAVFVKGKAKGDVRYPPYENVDDPELAAEHRKYQIYPMDHIRDYPRHIPYNSEKKSFLAKTGREAFEGKQEPSNASRTTFADLPAGQSSSTPSEFLVTTTNT